MHPVADCPAYAFSDHVVPDHSTNIIAHGIIAN
jgi:hypothetical protein